MKMLNKNIVLLIVALTSAFLGVLATNQSFFYGTRLSDGTKKVADQLGYRDDVGRQWAAPAKPQNHPAEIVENQNVGNEGYAPPTSAAALEKINQWRSARGYSWGGGVAGNKNEYESYSDDALNSLVVNGDIKAMIELADRLLKNHQNYSQLSPDALDKQRMELYYKASVYGSTLAAIKMGQILEYATNNPTPDIKRAQELEGLAWKAVASKRGDRGGFFSSLYVLNANNRGLTAAEEAQVMERSNVIYDELLERRKLLGLGDFDNSVPEELRYIDDTSYPESKGSPFLKR